MKNPKSNVLIVKHSLTKEEVEAHGQSDGMQEICEGIMSYELSEAVVKSDFMVFNRTDNEDGSIDLESAVVVMNVHEYGEFLKWWETMAKDAENELQEDDEKGVT